MRRRTLFILVLFFIVPAALKAQQVPIYSQYMMNKYLINPAYAGSQGYTSYNLTARQDMLGFDNANAPMTQALCAETRILQSSYLAKARLIKSRNRSKRPSGRVGLGGYLFNDRNGMINRTGLQGTYAYHIQIGDGQLSFGASGTVYQFKINKDELNLADQYDKLIDGRDNTMFIPDASAGIYYQYQNFQAGISTKNMFQSVLKFGSDESFSNYRLLRHHYLMTSYRYEIGEGYQIEPALLLRTTERMNFKADISVRGYYKNDYWLGLTYRTNSAVITMVGVKVGKIYFGYAYDYSLKEIQNITYGSHEIMIGIRFGDSQRRYRWLRRF